MYQTVPVFTISPPTKFGIQRFSSFVVDLQTIVNNPQLGEKIPYKIGKNEGHEVYCTVNGVPPGMSLEQWKFTVARMKELAKKENDKRSKVLDAVYTDPYLPYTIRSRYQRNVHARVFYGGPKEETNKTDPNARNTWLQQKFATIAECDVGFINNEIHGVMVEIVQELSQACPQYVFTYNFYAGVQERVRMDKFEITIAPRPLTMGGNAMTPVGSDKAQTVAMAPGIQMQTSAQMIQMTPVPVQSVTQPYSAVPQQPPLYQSQPHMSLVSAPMEENGVPLGYDREAPPVAVAYAEPDGLQMKGMPQMVEVTPVAVQSAQPAPQPYYPVPQQPQPPQYPQSYPQPYPPTQPPQQYPQQYAAQQPQLYSHQLPQPYPTQQPYGQPYPGQPQIVVMAPMQQAPPPPPPRRHFGQQVLLSELLCLGLICCCIF
jgi:hypothetical protein